MSKFLLPNISWKSEKLKVPFVPINILLLGMRSQDFGPHPYLNTTCVVPLEETSIQITDLGRGWRDTPGWCYHPPPPPTQPEMGYPRPGQDAGIPQDSPHPRDRTTEGVLSRQLFLWVWIFYSVWTRLQKKRKRLWTMPYWTVYWRWHHLCGLSPEQQYHPGSSPVQYVLFYKIEKIDKKPPVFLWEHCHRLSISSPQVSSKREPPHLLFRLLLPGLPLVLCVPCAPSGKHSSFYCSFWKKI